jgi:hypothetical protein
LNNFRGAAEEFDPLFVARVRALLTARERQSMSNTFFVMSGQSIQAAINAASAGDLIWVGPGTFNESLIIDKSLTLLSLDGAGTTVINGGPDPHGFSGAIRINTGVDFVTIGGAHNGFTINASANENAALLVGGNNSNVVIDGNTINGNNLHSDTQAVLGGGGLDHVSFLNNTFGGSATQLVYINGQLNVSNASTHVDFSGNTFSGTAAGALLVLDADHSTLTGNTFSGTGGAAVVLQQPGNTFAAGNDFSSYGAGTDIVTADTTFDLANVPTAQNIAGEFAATGVHFYGSSGDNDMTGNDTWLPSFSDDFNDILEGRGGNDTLHGLGGNDTAFYAGTITAANVSAVADIDPNTAGNQPGWQVDGTASNEGTDTLDDIEIITSASSHKILLVGNGGFGTIQAAIDAAAADDTILVAAGTYNENLEVTKSLTILGANRGVSGSETRGDETVLTGGFHITADNVTIDGFEIQDGRVDYGNQRTGVFLEGPRHDITITNSVIHETTTHGEDFQHGIVTHYAQDTYDLHITNNVFEGWNEGMYLNPGAHDSVIDHNVFTNNGNHIISDNPDDLTITNNAFNASDGSKIAVSSDAASTDFEAELGLSGNTFTTDSTRLSIYAYGSNGQQLLGTSGDDRFVGDYSSPASAGQVFTGRGGNDLLQGAGGNDTAKYTGAITIANLTAVADIDSVTPGNQPGWQVNASAGSEGTDTLSDVEIIQSAGATIRLVGNGGYDSVQDAITAAGAGDIVYIANGSYTGNVTLKSDITLVGESEAGVIINGTMLTPAALSNTTVSKMTVKNVGDTMLLDMRNTTDITDAVFDHVTFSLTGNISGPIAIGNGQVNGTIALHDGADGDTAGLTFQHSTMLSNNHVAGSTAFAFTLFQSIGGAKLLLDDTTLIGTASGAATGLGAQWNMSPQDSNTQHAIVEIKNSHTSGGGNYYISGFDDVSVHDNVFDGLGFALNGVKNGTVTGNTFQNVGALFTANGTQHRGLVIEDAFGTTGVSHISITGNIFDHITVADGAIAFQRFTDGSPANVATIARLNDLLISGNTFSGFSPGVNPVFIDGSYFPTGAALPPDFHSGQLILGTSAGNTIVDTSTGAMSIFGDAGGDTITGGAGDDLINGGDGTDTAVYSGARGSYLITDLGSAGIQVQDTRAGSPDGTDIVQKVENFQFSNGTFTAAQVVVNVAPVVTGTLNLAPVQVNSGARVITTSELLANVTDSDGPSALSVSSLTLASGSFGALVNNNNGTWTYTPKINDDSSAKFDISVTDGLATSTGSVILDITSVQNAPQIGGPGSDTFTAPTGNSQFSGGGGVDTISFNFKLVDATVTYSGNQVIIDGPTSHTVLNGFEVFQFTDGTVHNDDGNVLVDDLFYYSQYHDVWIAGADADSHYNGPGWHEGRDPNAFFDTSFYLSINQDVKAAGTNPLTHFDTSGWQENRQPSMTFDLTKYNAANPDVAAAHVDPLQHYLANGAEEGRQPFALTKLVASNGFDYVYYLQHNPDVAAAGVDPFSHFMNVGWKEGRNPNAFFDTNGYLDAYADVKAAGVNPLSHYNSNGWTEGRDPSKIFDTTDYLSNYHDVTTNPLLHFLNFGIDEGRHAFNDGVFG